jgi:hypothetical protein
LTPSVIEAKEGQEYKIKLKNFAVRRQGNIEGKFYVDGIRAGQFSDCASRHKAQWEGKTVDRTFRGFQGTNKDGMKVVRAFTFGTINVQKGKGSEYSSRSLQYQSTNQGESDR